jgi:hypothetical protein
VAAVVVVVDVGGAVVVVVVVVFVVVAVLVGADVDVVVVVVLLQDAKTSDVTMRQVSAIQIVPFFIHTSSLFLMIDFQIIDYNFVFRIFWYIKIDILNIIFNVEYHKLKRVYHQF